MVPVSVVVPQQWAPPQRCAAAVPRPQLRPVAGETGAFPC